MEVGGLSLEIIYLSFQARARAKDFLSSSNEVKRVCTVLNRGFWLNFITKKLFRYFRNTFIFWGNICYLSGSCRSKITGFGSSPMILTTFIRTVTELSNNYLLTGYPVNLKHTGCSWVSEAISLVLREDHGGRHPHQNHQNCDSYASEGKYKFRDICIYILKRQIWLQNEDFEEIWGEK